MSTAKFNDRLKLIIYFWLTYDLNKYVTHPKFDFTEVQTHDLQIMDSTFHVPEMLALTNELPCIRDTGTDINNSEIGQISSHQIVSKWFSFAMKNYNIN